MIYFTSDNSISCPPVYNYANVFFVAFSSIYIFLISSKHYRYINIQNNALCFHETKNLSLRLGCIRVNSSFVMADLLFVSN